MILTIRFLQELSFLRQYLLNQFSLSMGHKILLTTVILHTVYYKYQYFLA